MSSMNFDKRPPKNRGQIFNRDISERAPPKGAAALCLVLNRIKMQYPLPKTADQQRRSTKQQIKKQKEEP